MSADYSGSGAPEESRPERGPVDSVQNDESSLAGASFSERSAQPKGQDPAPAEEAGDLEAARFSPALSEFQANQTGDYWWGPTAPDGSVAHQPSGLIIPSVTEISSRGFRQWDIYSRLLEDRSICIDEPVTAPLASVVNAQMLWLKGQDSQKPINIFLNTPGGSVVDGLAIYDTMRSMPCDVNIFVRGQASSMGSVILSGGTKGRRFLLPNARVLLHSVRGGASGINLDVKKQAEEMDRLNTRLAQIIATNSNRTFEELQEAFRTDTFLDAHEAVEFGIADQVIESPDNVLIDVPKDPKLTDEGPGEQDPIQ